MANPKMIASVLKNMNPVPEAKGTEFPGGRQFKRGDLSPEQAFANQDAHKIMGATIPAPTEPQVSVPKVAMAKLPKPHIPRIK